MLHWFCDSFVITWALCTLQQSSSRRRSLCVGSCRQWVFMLLPLAWRLPLLMWLAGETFGADSLHRGGLGGVNPGQRRRVHCWKRLGLVTKAHPTVGMGTPMPAWLGGWLQCNHCKRGVVGFGLRSAGFWEGWKFGGLPPDPVTLTLA